MTTVVAGLLSIATFSFASSAYAASGSYSAEATTLVVTDAETGQPVSGVVGLIGWQIEYLTVTEVPKRYLEISESVTGVDGTLRFPGWGPLVLGMGSHFTYSSPVVLVFKRDYIPQTITNGFSMESPPPGLLGLREPLKNVRLKKNEPASKAYDDRVSAMGGHLRAFVANKSEVCNFERFPRMLSELIRAEESIPEAKRRATAFLRLDSHHKAHGCASLKTLLGGLEK